MQIRKFTAKKGGKVIEYNVAVPENFQECSQFMEEHEAYRYLLVGYLEWSKRVALGTMPKVKKFIKIQMEGLQPHQRQGLAQLGLLGDLPGERVVLEAPLPPQSTPVPVAAAPAETATASPTPDPTPSVDRTPERVLGVPPQLRSDPVEPHHPEQSDEDFAKEFGLPSFG